MGRKPKLNEPQDVPAVEDEQDFFDGVLSEFDDEEGVEIEGKIYRKTKPEDSIGRMSFEAIAKVFEKVDEDWIGRNFGSGNYFIKWTFRKGDRKELRQKNYSIGPEYDKFIKEKAPAVSGAVPAVSGLDLGGLLGSLTVDKVAAIGSAIKIIKDIFAPPPPPPPVDLKGIFEVIAATQQKTTPSDAIVTACLSTLQKPQQPAQSIAQQIADYNALKEIFENNSTDNAEGGEMSILLEQAFKYLPILLQKKNNDYRAVGQEARQNPMVQGLILNDPDLAQKFFERAREIYGDENARALAAGFGLKMDILPGATAQQSEVVKNG